MNSLIYKKENLSNYSWFGLGGQAESLFKPKTLSELKNFLKGNKDKKKDIYILGAGSNTLFRDRGFKGTIIKLGSEFSYSNLLDKNKIEVGASCLDKKLSDFAYKNSLSGFEFLSCIPGTIGGGIAMNCGCYGYDISQIFYSLKAIDFNGETKTFGKNEIKFFYRGSDLPRNLIFISAVLEGKVSNQEEIKNKQHSLQIKKNKSQPSKIKTCGSTFKNPENKKAWELIKISDCSALMVGGAKMSPKHCNFFLNDGNATTEDVETLINEVKKRVLKKTGVNLELEIKIIGEK